MFQTCVVLKCCCCCCEGNVGVQQKKSTRRNHQNCFLLFFFSSCSFGKIQNRLEGSVLLLAPVRSRSGIGGLGGGVHVEGGRCSRPRQTEGPARRTAASTFYLTAGGGEQTTGSAVAVLRSDELPSGEEFTARLAARPAGTCCICVLAVFFFFIYEYWRVLGCLSTDGERGGGGGVEEFTAWRFGLFLA